MNTTAKRSRAAKLGHARRKRHERADRRNEVIKNNIVLNRIRSERGFAAKIARECGVSREAVWLWERVPAERAFDVQRVTGYSMHTIRPDLYPKGKMQWPSTGPQS